MDLALFAHDEYSFGHFWAEVRCLRNPSLCVIGLCAEQTTGGGRGTIFPVQVVGFASFSRIADGLVK